MRQDYDGVPVVDRDQLGMPVIRWETVLRDQHHLGATDRLTKAFNEEMDLAVALGARKHWWLKWVDCEGFWTHEPSQRWVSYGGGIRAKNVKRFLLWEHPQPNVEQEPRAFATISELIDAAEA